MLTGTSQRVLDSKGRVTLPAEYRRDFEGKVCLLPFKDALYGFTPEGYQEWMIGLFERDGKSFDPRSRSDVRLRKLLNASCQTVDVDSAGRIALGKLGAEKLAALGLEHDVTIIGDFDHIEIWDSAKWEAENEGLQDDLEALMFGATE